MPRRQLRSRTRLPAFGEDSVLDRGPGGPSSCHAVRSVLACIDPMADGPPVVWWDPAALVARSRGAGAAPASAHPGGGSDGAAAAASEQNYAAWKMAREALLARASQPSMSVQTVTSLARAEATEGFGESEGEVEVQAKTSARYSPARSCREGGARRHRAARRTTLRRTCPRHPGVHRPRCQCRCVQASAAINGRIVGATEEEVQAAIVTVGTALGHPILRRAAASAGKGGLRRETPVLLTLDDGSLVEGVVDLAFREDTPDFAGWTVVDFKTDREFAVSSARYIAQVRVYSEAVGAATGSPARGIVLVFLMTEYRSRRAGSL